MLFVIILFFCLLIVFNLVFIEIFFLWVYLIIFLVVVMFFLNGLCEVLIIIDVKLVLIVFLYFLKFELWFKWIVIGIVMFKLCINFLIILIIV